MKSFLAQNIDTTGRATRAAIAVALFLAAWFIHADVPWLSVALVIAGLFTCFEALRGWCALRACGIKTRL